MSGRAVPREEGVTFESGSGGMRMEKGRGAAAVGQPLYRPLYIRAGRLRTRLLAATYLRTPAPQACVWSWCVCLRPPRCVSTGPVVVRLAEMAN